MNTAHLLDLAKQRHAVSDYGLSKMLGVGSSTISNYRNGRSHPDDRLAEELAKLAGLDPGEVAAWMQVERAKDSQARALWQGVAQRLARAGVAGLVGVVALAGPPDAGASVRPFADAGHRDNPVYYVNLPGNLARDSASRSPHTPQTPVCPATNDFRPLTIASATRATAFCSAAESAG